MSDTLKSLALDLELRLEAIPSRSPAKARMLREIDLESVVTMASAHVTFGIMSKATFVGIVSKIGREILACLEQPYDVRVAIQLGSFVLESFVNCGLVQEDLRIDGGDKNHTYYVIADDRAGLSALMELVKPEKVDHFPSLEPFDDWTSGYHSNGLFLVRNASQSVLQAIEPETHGIVLDSVNKLQRSGWIINEEVATVFERYLDDKRGHGNVLPHQDTKLDRGKRSSYRIEAEVIKKAMDYIGEDTFYHQYNVDFRGRIYPVTAFLHEQSSDRSKGLLKFAEATPLGEDGYKWLCIHAANSWGEDKLPLLERELFAASHMDEWLEYAYDPIGNRGWEKADKPWSFLACCFEFAELREYCYQHDVDTAEYPCNLPIFIDGSNNGVQHLSALSKDRSTGALVNLVPTEIPGDVYMSVCNTVYSKLEAMYDPELDDQFNRFYKRSMELDAEISKLKGSEKSKRVKIVNRWRKFCKASRFAPNYFMSIKDKKVRRKLVKRPVMTLGYGGTRNGFKDQVLEDTRREGAYLAGMNHSWAQLFGDLIYFSCRGGKGHEAQLPGLAAMLELFESLAETAVDEGKTLKWIVPFTNLPVVQQYWKPQRVRVEVQFCGRSLELYAQNFQISKVNKGKQKTSASPNIVHSFDAAHLQLTVTACDFRVATVHDSFGCSPGNMEDLFRIVRETFVKFYEADPLLQLLTQQDAVDRLPNRGDLDVREILDSDFAFV